MAMTPSEMTLLVVAALNAFTAWMTWRAHNEVVATKNVVLATQHDVAVIEKATNSLTDRLVASTDKASRAEGRAQGLVQGKAEGKAEGNKKPA